jgi:murein DD-endopeptidase MepM/ murein hydrolase activator NlpD
MKRLILPLAVLLALTAPRLAAQISAGNYAIPYQDGTDMTALVDHTTHTLTNRVDLRGRNDTNIPPNYVVAAAAAGIVRAIRDTNAPGCVNCLNFVWIEHPNGEWTGYSHLRQGSVTSLGLSVGDAVTAGQPIGMEGTVGSPGGQRLRFEVGVPTNPNAPITSGGLLVGTSRIPAICNIPENVFRAGTNYEADVCIAQEFSYGTYRLPFTNGVNFFVSGDHLTHTPKTRLDLVGQSGMTAPFAIVAAAAGVVRAVVETNFIQCTGSSGCSASNNYVWIQHSSGEWTKYTHFVQNSVAVSVGQNVVAGQFLGLEGAVGWAGGIHLHFEVGVPARNSLADINPSGGFLTNGINRIPMFCNVAGGMVLDNQFYLSGPCGGGSCDQDIVVPGATIRGTRAYIASDTVDTGNNNIAVDTYGSLALLAGNKVTFRPGFRAAGNSYVRAAIQPCVNPP